MVKSDIMKINESYVLDIISAWFKCALWPAFVFDFYFPCGGKFFLVLKNNKGILCCIFCGVFVNCVIHTFWYSDDIIPYTLCEYESPVEPGTWFSVIEAKNSIHRNNIGCIDNISHILRQFYLYYFSGGRLTMRRKRYSRKVMQIQPSVPKRKLSRHSGKE